MRCQQQGPLRATFGRPSMIRLGFRWHGRASAPTGQIICKTSDCLRDGKHVILFFPTESTASLTSSNVGHGAVRQAGTRAVRRPRRPGFTTLGRCIKNAHPAQSRKRPDQRPSHLQRHPLRRQTVGLVPQAQRLKLLPRCDAKGQLAVSRNPIAQPSPGTRMAGI